MKKKERYLKGSMTIEITYMIPLLMMMLVFSIRGTFYFHDKNILISTAYETVAVASTKIREEKPITEEEVARIFQTRIQGKCLLFVNPGTEVSIEKESISICVTEQKNKMAILIELKGSITEPEKTVRSIQILRRQVGINERSSGTN